MSHGEEFLFGGVYSPNLQFIVYLLVGLAVAGVLAWPARGDDRSTRFRVLGVLGVCGAWFGAEAAHLFGQVPQGGAPHFLSALVGALGLAYLWRRWHPSEATREPSLPRMGETPR
jgi:uncharacterized membrane protein YeaQ/YmgE (transglycosylase-associated protein family)